MGVCVCSWQLLFWDHSQHHYTLHWLLLRKSLLPASPLLSHSLQDLCRECQWNYMKFIEMNYKYLQMISNDCRTRDASKASPALLSVHAAMPALMRTMIPLEHRHALAIWPCSEFSWRYHDLYHLITSSYTGLLPVLYRSYTACIMIWSYRRRLDQNWINSLADLIPSAALDHQISWGSMAIPASSIQYSMTWVDQKMASMLPNLVVCHSESENKFI